ncbi:MAG: hypothetical protein HQK72_00140 [Desulfamplus sp.]|nr:hypothetical protein [Desulfamplus sp.]
MNFFKKNVSCCLILSMFCFCNACATRSIDINEPINSGRDVKIEIPEDSGDASIKKGFGSILSALGIIILLGGLVALASAAPESDEK